MKNQPKQILNQKIFTTQNSSSRFQLKRLVVFDDNVAYENKRAVYILTDTLNNVEYVGISGIGISQLGSHGSGKTSTSDER